MSELSEENIEKWVLGLLERAEYLGDMLDKPSIPSIEVAELTGYAKSSLVLLTREQAQDYHRKKNLRANT